MSKNNNNLNDEISKNKELKNYTREVLEEYKYKIFNETFKIWRALPLDEEETKKCKVYEQNLNFLRQTIFLHAYQNLGYDINESFGVSKITTLKNLPEHVPTKKRQQEFAFPFNDKFRKKLLYAKKFKFYEEEKDAVKKGFRKDQHYKSIARYYLTEIEHKGNKQIVVIKTTEDLFNPEISEFKEQYVGSNFSIHALLGKNCKKVMSLARLDYNKGRPNGHQNFFDENGNVLNFGQVNWDRAVVYGTHMHFETEKLELMCPYKIGSGDAIEIDDTNKSFFDLKNEMNEKFNFYDNNYTFTEDMRLVDIYNFLKSKHNEEVKSEENNR